jgi:glutamine synthetase
VEDLVYVIPKIVKDKKNLKEFLSKNPAIKFVSFFGIDFLGNDTDERIPVNYFVENLEEIINGGIQTDGSSVNLPGIAGLSDAKINFIIDFDRKWLVDYNFENKVEGNPVGTLKIPVFFKFHDNYYDSRFVLKETIKYVKKELLEILKNNEKFLNRRDIDSDQIENIYFTMGTELEFWVRTPADKVSEKELTISQMLKESYWKRTKGRVRTCLENSLLLLEKYDYKPEMGHKEVGGIKAKVSPEGDLYDVMQQLEMDWKYSNPMQTCDNELFARVFVKELFRREGLEVSFAAKPIPNVAGSGEHMHVGIGLELKSGKRVNLFSPDSNNHYLSGSGYSALMGILKNWNKINPFVSHSIDAFKRLKPGYEAPVAPVACLGGTPNDILRNRTVLIGIVRSENPLTVRFEIRAPNPHTNSYLAASAIYLAILDGIKYGINKDEDALYSELMKKRGEEANYLSEDREYITTKDIFEEYSREERENLYGAMPETVWENVTVLKKHLDFYKNTPLTEKIINSYYKSVLNKWKIELEKKEIKNIKNKVAKMKRKKEEENDYDAEKWEKIEELKSSLFKSKIMKKSLEQKIKEEVRNKNYEELNCLIKELRHKFEKIEEIYSAYEENFT